MGEYELWVNTNYGCTSGWIHHNRDGAGKDDKLILNWISVWRGLLLVYLQGSPRHRRRLQSREDRSPAQALLRQPWCEQGGGDTPTGP